MAVIQTIRNKLGPIIVIVIGLSLAFFVLETALQSEMGLLRGTSDVVAVIDGEKIRYRDLVNRIDEAVQNYRLQTNQNQIDDNTMNTLREQVWNQIINEKVNFAEYEKLGIVVPVEELKYMFFSADAIPEIRQAFTNPQTGSFDPVAVLNYYENLDQTGPNERVGERRMRWVAFEKAQIEQRLQRKYNDLIKGALYVPNWMARSDYEEKNRRASIRFVRVPYTSVPDTAVTWTDAELEQYLKENSARYKQQESRKIEYVLFTVIPSAEDSSRAREQIEAVYEQFLLNPVDTDIIKLHADKGLDPMYYHSDDIESETVADTLFQVPVGTMLGPYLEEGVYRFTVLLDRRPVADSVKARHILIRVGPDEDSTVARKRIDSIAAELDKGVPFDSLAKALSQDEGSANRGGDLGYLGQGQTVRNFNRFLFFDGQVGDRKIVRTEFGYHLIRIDDVKGVEPAVQIAVVSRPIEVSGMTDKLVYERAQKFASENQTVESFIRSASEQRLNKLMAPMVMRNTYSLPGLQQAREIVQWAYKAKVGEVSPPFALDNHYVVVVLSEVKQEGTPSVDAIRQQLEFEVRKQKKAQLIVPQLAQLLSLNSTLEAVATQLNQPINKAEQVAFSNAYAENLGYEPFVVGSIFGLERSRLSPPIIGEQGVYVVQIEKMDEPVEIADYNQFKTQILSSIQPRFQYQVGETLKKSVKIEDNRIYFF